MSCGELAYDYVPTIEEGVEDGKITQMPWMVSLGVYFGTGYEHQCGGSIVTTRHILTAAHCFQSHETPPEKY